MKSFYCHCKACKKAKRKGLILGSRLHYNGSWVYVSAYVPFPRFMKGRRPEAVVD